MFDPLAWLSEDQVLRLQKRQLAPAIVLTVVLFLRVFMAPLADETVSIMNPLNHLLVVCALTYMAATTRRHLLIAGTLGAVSVLLEVLVLLLPQFSDFAWLQVIISVALYIYVFWLMLRELFTARRVEATTLLLAVNCYLLIGLVWTMAYMAVESLSPVRSCSPGIPTWRSGSTSTTSATSR